MRQLLLILTASLSLTAATTSAQTDTAIKKSNSHSWMSGGVQYFLSDNLHSLIGGQLGLNSSFNQRHFIKLKGYAGVTTSWTLLNLSQPDRLVTIANLSLLYGLGKYASSRSQSFYLPDPVMGQHFFEVKKMAFRVLAVLD